MIGRNANETTEEYELRLTLMRHTGREIRHLERHGGRWFAQCVDGLHEVSNMLRTPRYNQPAILKELCRDRVCGYAGYRSDLRIA